MKREGPRGPQKKRPQHLGPWGPVLRPVIPIPSGRDPMFQDCTLGSLGSKELPLLPDARLSGELTPVILRVTIGTSCTGIGEFSRRRLLGYLQ